MNLGLEWINSLLEWLVGWLPTQAIMEHTHRGVRVTVDFWMRPKEPTEIPPGPYWYFPRWTKIYSTSVKPEVHDLPSQSVDSIDGKRSIMFSVSLVCRVRNVKKWLLETENPEDIIKEVGAGAAADCIATRTAAAVRRDFASGKLEEELFEAAKDALSRPYGVEVVDARLTDCCGHLPHRVEGATIPPSNQAEED